VSAFLFIYADFILELVNHSQSNMGSVPIFYYPENILQIHPDSW